MVKKNHPKIKKHSKITFCTTCMDYTKFLKITYLANLVIGERYDCDFVLVNYNSHDDMENWVKQNLDPYIKSGKLVYYHTTKPRHFNMSKAKNMAHRLATGEILCNLDADNFLTKEFMDWAYAEISKDNHVITQGSSHGGGGRVLVNKGDFYAVGGYNETIKNQLGDHADFVIRVKKLGRKDLVVPNEIMAWIDNTKEERYRNFK